MLYITRTRLRARNARIRRNKRRDTNAGKTFKWNLNSTTPQPRSVSGASRALSDRYATRAPQSDTPTPPNPEGSLWNLCARSVVHGTRCFCVAKVFADCKFCRKETRALAASLSFWTRTRHSVSDGKTRKCFVSSVCKKRTRKFRKNCSGKSIEIQL